MYVFYVCIYDFVADYIWDWFFFPGIKNSWRLSFKKWGRRKRMHKAADKGEPEHCPVSPELKWLSPSHHALQ